MKKEDSMLFFDEAVEYYKAASILKESPNTAYDDNYLFSPIAYLTRHAFELLFKALIIQMHT